MTEKKTAAAYLNALSWTKRINMIIFLLLILLNILINFAYEEQLSEATNVNKEKNSTEPKPTNNSIITNSSDPVHLNNTVTYEEVSLNDYDKTINRKYCGEE
ncbi:4236_t:CDS:2, partial [Acaulospora colombiana]